MDQIAEGRSRVLETKMWCTKTRVTHVQENEGAERDVPKTALHFTQCTKVIFCDNIRAIGSRLASLLEFGSWCYEKGGLCLQIHTQVGRRGVPCSEEPSLAVCPLE